ncbi:putative glycolipid-binding domain-containing protein [Pseudarthrobacter sp902506025]|uniref:Glycolipid-binding protein n=1 Tax=Pseudarthrobacter defluvii TaxID=410837 RepID=A0ABT9UFK3_9MICC|nr:putative glycolipid-binding domain-containing protein [Pseudarthrobacter defluvii]MDQ0118416.1 hypothetical protein [Pseudarthrobacter defluvii]
MNYTWYGIETPSIEKLHFTAEGETLRALSTWVNENGHYDYEVTLDRRWIFRELRLHRHDDGQLEIRRHRDGTWNVNQVLRPDLQGAVDVDLALSPFTNTLPVRRLDLPLGVRTEIITAYVAVPSLQVTPDPQAYTRTAANLYLYESLDSDFSRQITVDADGFVIDYPGLYTRDPAAGTPRPNA